MVTKIDETASILHRWPSEKAAKCSDSRVVQRFSTQLQLSSCSLPSAAKTRAKEAGIRSDKHFQAATSPAQSDFNAERQASLTDDGLRSELLSTRRRLAEAMNILVERKNQSRKLGWSVNRAGAQVDDCKRRKRNDLVNSRPRHVPDQHLVALVVLVHQHVLAAAVQDPRDRLPLPA